MDGTTIAALVGAGVSLTIGILGFLRSKKVDDSSAKSGVASDHRAGTQQVIDGMTLLLTQAQETIKEGRETIKEDREVIEMLETKIGAFNTEREAWKVDLAACKAENARLIKQYGDSGIATT